MATLHLTRVAFGAEGVDTLAANLSARAIDGRVSLTTRYRPRRHAELIGGSLYWIISHQIVARSPIAGFFDDDEIGKCQIIVQAPLILVRPTPRRAHQGWRYFDPGDAPPDMQDGEDAAPLPPTLSAALAGLGLVWCRLGAVPIAR